MFTRYAATKRPARPALILAVLLALPAAGLPRAAQAATTTLTETGQLLTSTAPPAAVANGSYDLQFQLFNAAAAGTQVGPTVTVPSVPVVGGVYYAQADFGNVFGGQAYWVQVSYRPHPVSGNPPYTPVPARSIVPSSGNADYALLSGNTRAIQGKGILSTVPTAGQTLTYNGTNWAPATPAPDAAYTAGAGLTVSSNKFSIPTGGVTASMLGAGSVGASAITVPLSLTGTSNGGVLQASNSGAIGAGVLGQNNNTGDFGLLGGTEPVSGSTIAVGVFGADVASSGGIGVFGDSVAGFGVVGNSSVSSAAGLLGISSSTGLNESGLGYGVEGITGGGKGVYGSSDSGDGIYGVSNGGNGGYFTTGGLDGLYSESTGNNGNGVAAVANVGSAAYGLYAASTSGFAAVFSGKVQVNGNLTVTGAITAGTKDFRIDDPLDPAGKYLSHACIESDQMADLYSGNVVTDGAGNAVISLPAWFQALNKDFRYELTCVGQFAQAIVATKVHDNAFGIKTDKPNVEVSWQVTGVRQDAYALAHPLQVEEDKPAEEQGLFLHPKEQGQPEEQGIGFQQQRAHEAHAPKRP